MALNLRSFAQLVEDQAAAVQARATALLDFTTGSIMRSFIEAVAGVALWLESQIVYVLSLTRAATSRGTDLDSWMNDYGVTRLAASLSAGSVTFSRFVATSEGIVPVGTLVRTTDGTQTFTVQANTANAAYSSVQNGYVLGVGVLSVSVPVKANIPGPGANVAAGTITLIASQTPGIDTVNNVAAMSGGANAETDEALRARFVTYIASLSKATKIAIGYAVQSLQLGAQYSIVENQDYTGATVYGFFYVTVDDGTGYPSASLLNAAATAIENTRAAGVRYGVFAPIVLSVTVSFSIKAATGYDANTLAGLAGNAVTAYVNALPLGQSLAYTKLAQIAYEASPGILNVDLLFLNGAKQDVGATPKNVIKVSTVAVGISP